MKQPFLSLFIHHALVLTIIFGTIYTIVQQNYRMSANDPQIQMAEDAANDLSNGVSPQTLTASTTRDIAQTISPFVVIYDDTEKAVAWSGTISGKPPVLPDGVLDFTRANGEDRVTWQPRNDVRIAAILKHYSGSKPGFVLVGRSLREVEEREYSLMMLVGTGWILSLVTDVFCVWVRRRTM
jgi:hypothetical protein